MKVHVRLFAVARQLAGADLATVEIPDNGTVADLRRQLGRAIPGLDSLVPFMMFAVGSEYVDDRAVILPGADVACIPPVSGG